MLIEIESRRRDALKLVITHFSRYVTRQNRVQSPPETHAPRIFLGAIINRMSSQKLTYPQGCYAQPSGKLHQVPCLPVLEEPFIKEFVAVSDKYVIPWN